jgi:phosphoglycolate phosphatase-like HAD superfamily hydrolase
MHEHIAFDADGVLIDLDATFFRWMEKRYGVHVDVHQRHHWDFQYDFDIPQDVLPEMWKYIWSNPALPYPGAISMIRQLQRTGEKVSVVSYRPEGLAKEAALRDFPALGIPSQDIHLVNDGPKSKVLNRIRPTVFLEDNPTNATEAFMGWGGKVYLLNRPWNHGCSAVIHKSWETVANYDDFIGRLSN